MTGTNVLVPISISPTVKKRNEERTQRNVEFDEFCMKYRVPVKSAFHVWVQWCVQRMHRWSRKKATG